MGESNVLKNWNMSYIGDCCFVTKLAGYEYTKHFDYSIGGKIIALRVLNLKSGKLDLSDVQTIPKKTSDLLPRSKLAAGDIAISYVGTVGEVALISHNNKFHLAPNVAKITPNQSLLTSEFLLQSLSSDSAKRKIDLLGSLTSQPSLSMGNLRKVALLTPPLPEQKKIATILTSVDTVIEKTQAQIDKLNDLKTGMMQELLTKGIGPDGKPHTEFKDSPVGRIPVGWEFTTLGDVVVTKGLQTGPFGSQLHAHEYLETGIPVVMPKDMKRQRVDTQSIAQISLTKADSLDKHRVRKGDILFSRRGDIGRFALAMAENENWICGTGCLRARLNDSVSPEFITSYLTLAQVIDWLNENAVGQTMLNLNTSILAELPIAVPPIAEQKVISDTISAVSNNTTKKLLQLKRLKNLKSALMQDLLTGRVRVTPDP